MAKPNYSFEKRQRELGKKRKKEEKLKRKLTKDSSPEPVVEEQQPGTSGTGDSAAPAQGV